MESFKKLFGSDNPILKTIEERGFEAPTEIQEKSIPEILKGKDVVAGASTGSGKTLAFGVALIKNAKKDYGIQGLVLTPTRELAEQVTKELADFAKYKDLNVLAIYGGMPIFRQIKMLESAEIVVATPGRILDHLKRNSIDLSKVNTLTIDEADRMFDMGFIDDVQSIIAHCPKKRQTLLFSATISPEIVKLSDRYMENPVEISAKSQVDPKKLKQVYYDVEDNLKFSLLKHLLEKEDSKLIMIFCNTRKNVDFISKNLMFMGLNVVPIHGGFSQEKRNRFLEEFNKENKVNILVATDVAARGLHIEGVSHIYNYDIPLNKTEYIHRIGRTARAGKEGKVINILTGRHYDNFQDIVNSKEFAIKREEAPYLNRVRIRWMPEKRHERRGRHQGMGRGGDRGPSRGGDGGRGPRGSRREGTGGGRGREGERKTYGDKNRTSYRDNRDDREDSRDRRPFKTNYSGKKPFSTNYKGNKKPFHQKKSFSRKPRRR